MADALPLSYLRFYPKDGTRTRDHLLGCSLTSNSLDVSEEIRTPVLDLRGQGPSLLDDRDRK